MLTPFRSASLVGAAVLVLIGGGPLAAADDGPTAGAGNCGLRVCVDVYVPGHGPSPHGAVKGEESPASKPEDQCKTPKGRIVPCHDADQGDFSGGCYYKIATRVPLDPNDPAWRGHGTGNGASDGTGAMYWKNCPDDGSSTWVWLATPPAGVAVDPAVLAQRAVDSMLLDVPDVHINPEPGGRGVVGMPVWMWVGQSKTTWGPNSASASAGGITVRAVATVSQVVWSMGDRQSVTCTSPGTPYQAAFGMKQSPDCGYAYSATSAAQPGGKFHVVATSTWTIPWQGGGQQGTLTVTRTSAVDLTVGEAQVLN